MPATAADPAAFYDRRSIVLHWITAAAVAGLWGLGQTIDDFAKGDPRTIARSVHIVAGACLALLLAYRLWWRLPRGAATLRRGAGWSWTDRVASLLHLALYVLLVVTVLLGLANAWVRGDTLWHLFKIPALDPGNDGLRETVEGAHALAANALVAFAALHAAVALVHHHVLRDDVLRRMWPRLGRRSDGANRPRV